MKYEDIQKASKSIKTTDIRGKQYAEVNQRIKAFRMLCPNGCITSEILSNADGVVIMKASVMDEDGKLLGTGTAYEKEGSSNINKTSYIENCETSAVGRALAMSCSEILNPFPAVRWHSILPRTMRPTGLFRIRTLLKLFQPLMSRSSRYRMSC